MSFNTVEKNKTPLRDKKDSIFIENPQVDLTQMSVKSQIPYFIKSPTSFDGI